MELFGTAGIRGPVSGRITPTLAVNIGHAVATYATETHADPSLVLGHDGRQTSPALTDAIAAGATASGVPVTTLGELPTPALAFTSQDRHGVMVTASHNPPPDNGIKLFADGVEYDSAAESRIETLLDTDPDPAPWEDWQTSVSNTVLNEYTSRIIEYARGFGSHLDGLSIVVDCGNGTASHATPTVLKALGGDIVTLHGNVDGFFPGRPSKPTPETLTGCQAFIADGDFDLGIAHDGDGDRVVFLDSTGEIVHEDTILAILATAYLETQTVPDPVVITTPNASSRIDDRVNAAGGRTHRTALGSLHEAIAEIQASDETVVFAGEPWKHIHPALGGWIDGVASAAVIARLTAAAGLDTLREPIQERPYRKLSVDCPDHLKQPVLDRLETKLPEAVTSSSVTTEFGVRITRPDESWILVRASGTEPKIRIYVEADDVDTIVETVRQHVVASIDSVE